MIIDNCTVEEATFLISAPTQQQCEVCTSPTGIMLTDFKDQDCMDLRKRIGSFLWQKIH